MKTRLLKKLRREARIMYRLRFDNKSGRVLIVDNEGHVVDSFLITSSSSEWEMKRVLDSLDNFRRQYVRRSVYVLKVKREIRRQKQQTT